MYVCTLDHRVCEKLRCKCLGHLTGGGAVPSFDLEADGPPDPESVDFREPERRQRTFDGGALWVCDPWTQLHFDEYVETHSGTVPIGKTPSADVFISRDVTRARLAHHLWGKIRWGWLLVPSTRLEPVADRLLVERGRVAPTFVATLWPKARGVRSKDFVAKGELPVDRHRYRRPR